MMSRKAASFVLVLLVTASSFGALLPASGGRGPQLLTVKEEWKAGPYNETPEILVNDTDGDGKNELIIYLNYWGMGPGGKDREEHWLRAYELPEYTLAWSKDFTTDFQLELVDTGQNGSVRILLTQFDENGTWFELYGGPGFQKLWVSTHFAGSLTGQTILDVDGDEVTEMLFANGSMTGDKMNFTFEYRLQILDLKTGMQEWESPGMTEQVNDLRTAELDGDAALEILLFLAVMYEDFTMGNGLSVYDGSTHAVQWTLPVNATLASLGLIDTGEMDGDRGKEVLLSAGWTNGTESSAGFLMLSATDGAAEWSLGVVNGSFSQETADIDNDTLLELLATESVSDENWNTNVTLRIFDLKAQKEVWSMGPFQGGMFGGTPTMLSQDLTGDRVPEVIVFNSTFDFINFSMSYSYLVIDGKTLSELWQSPTFSGYGSMPQALPLDNDADWEILVADSWTDTDGNSHGLLHVYDTKTWKEEWTSDDYLATIVAVAMDVINDSRPEILLMVAVVDQENGTTDQKFMILDPATHEVIWTSPAVPEFTPSFPQLYGSPRNEIVLLVNEGDYPSQTSRLLVYNDTTLEEAWRSESYDGAGTMEQQGDFDSDGRGELMVAATLYNPDRTSTTNLTVLEFLEEPLKQADLAVSSGDIAVSNSTPMAGTKITVSALVRNLGDGAAMNATVALALDGTQVDSTTADIPAGGTVNVNFTWAARLGDHTLAVRLDPRNLIAEPDETNNNASVSVSVSRPPKPVAAITSPTEGQEIPEGRSITFDGTGSFVPEGGNTSWFSEQDGFLGTALLFNATLPLGEHYVTLYVDDGQNNVSATVNFTVTPPPPPPGTTWAVITSPRTGAIFKADDAISFDGSRSIPARPEYNLTYLWSSNQSGPLGNLSMFTASLPSGFHNITLRVDDGHGGTSTASVNIRVREAPNVKAVISSPAEGQSFEVTANIQFDGSSSTGPTGAVLSYMWSSNQSGPFGTQKAFSARLGQGAHKITLAVSDGAGHNGTATVNISVKRSQDYKPTVAITFPANGSTVSGTVKVNGTAWDDVAVMGVSLKIDDEPWGTVSGALNWFYYWNTNTTKYPNGQHKITVRANDGGQSSDEVIIFVTVNNTNPPAPVKPPGEKKDDTMLYVGIGAVAILAVVGVAAALMLRKK